MATSNFKEILNNRLTEHIDKFDEYDVIAKGVWSYKCGSEYNEIARFLSIIQIVADFQHEEIAMDIVYDVIDDLMWLQDISTLNEIFTAAFNSSLPDDIDLKLSLLTASFPMKEELPTRVKLLEVLKSDLSYNGEKADQILKNLWP